MITARLKVSNTEPQIKEAKAYMELEWKDNVVDVYSAVELRVDIRPFYEGIAVTSGRKYVQSWSPVPDCAFLEIMGRFNQENRLEDIFLDTEKEDEEVE